jgi:hypothetical protein
MRCLMAGLTILLMLSGARADTIKFCFLFCSVETAPVVDSFCQTYQRVNQSAADSAEIKKLSRAPKVRLNANDVLYLCKCKAWDNAICKK